MVYPRAVNGFWEFDGSWPLVGGQVEDALENFESGSLSGYSGDLSSFTVQSQYVIRGYYSLYGQGSYDTVGDDGGHYPTPRESTPQEYRSYVYCLNGGEASMGICCQSESTPFRNCYAVTIDADDNEFRFYSRNAGSTNYIERNNMTLNENTIYRPFITVTEEGVNAGVYDSGGTEMFRTDSYHNTDHSGGGLLWRTGDGGDIIFDHATVQPGTMGDIDSVVIDDFEDGDLDEYNSPSSTGSKTVEPAAALYGNYGLEMDGFGQVYTLPGMGLSQYLETGVEYEFYFNPQVTGSQQYYIFLCPQHNDSQDDTYELEFIMGGSMRIQKDDNGSENTLSGSGSGEPSVAFTNEVSWQSDNWYRVDVTIQDSQPYIRADLYDHSSGDFIAYVEQDEDSEFISPENGFGFYSSGSGRLYVDQVQQK